MPSQRPQRLFTLADAANELGLSQRTIRRYIAAGRIAAYRVGPRVVRVDLDEIDKLVRPIQTVGTAS